MDIAKSFTKVDINKNNNAFMRLDLDYRDVFSIKLTRKHLIRNLNLFSINLPSHNGRCQRKVKRT